MAIHIGKLIEQRLLQVGMTKSEFARRIFKARQNVNDILNRKSIDSDLLLAISKALKYDFFQHYITELNSEQLISEPRNEFLVMKEQISGYEHKNSEISMKLAVAAREVELQNTIIDLLKKQLGQIDKESHVNPDFPEIT